tara:strand:- start:184 stop:885 length:702 start_codon:yes stop_codon:yes gene_type:complete
MPKPVDLKMYNKIKASVIKKHPKHSAYRSGLIVQKYKKTFKNKYNNKSPYHGNKTEKHGLSRWFAEDWRNQRNSIGYKYKSDIYRPTRRITKKTPITFNELTKKQIKKARLEKAKTKRVKRFNNKGGGNINMNERLLKIIKPTVNNKKYTAIVENIKTNKQRRISFGGLGYEQFKDSTKLKLYTKYNHGDINRRNNYFNRHSGTPNKNDAINKEIKKSKGLYNAKILSHIYLW